MEWSTACPDWEQRLIEGRSLVPFDPLFPAEAQAALDVFRDLRIVDAPGSPTMAEACREWVFDFVGAIFGAYDADAGRRLINDFFLLVSKKNSKSTIAAGIMLTALIRNWRMSAEFAILAPTIEVANNSFGPARDMIRVDDQLADMLHVQANTRTITHRVTGATLKVVAADSETVAGKKTVGVLVDELWLFGKRADAANMLREAAGGLASRPEGFVIALSTQSDDQPAGVFAQRLKYFRGIRDGTINAPRSLGVLYELPKSMVEAESYRDEGTWHLTNPNLGRSVDMEFLRDEFAKAELAGAADLKNFFAKHLNVEIGLRLASDRWPGADFWEARADGTISPETLVERCDVVVATVDGGGLDDLLALCLTGRERVTRRWLQWHATWCDRSVLDLRKEIAPRLLDFEAAGELTIVEDMTEAFGQLADIVAEIDAFGLLPEKGAVGLDPMGVGLIIDALAERGIAGERVVGISQGWRLNGAIKTTAVKLKAGEIWHSGQAITAWAVGNAKQVPQGNAVTITKQSSGTAKIDPLTASLIGVEMMSRNPEGVGTSVFDRMARESAQKEGDPAQSGADQMQGGDIDMQILADPSHPRWQEMRERHESQFETDDEDYF